jgi:putative transposase
MVISDAHTGLVASIRQDFLGTSWQRCCVHFLRNIIESLPKKKSDSARHDLKAIFQAPSLAHARQLKDAFIKNYKDVKGYSKAVEKLDEGFEDSMHFMHTHLSTIFIYERIICLSVKTAKYREGKRSSKFSLMISQPLG